MSMVLRLVQFLVGALVAAGGGYLSWLNRGSFSEAFPPSAETAPWLLIAGLGLLIVGSVTLIGALGDRPEQRARLAAEAQLREETLNEADTYYAERARGEHLDWDFTKPADTVVEDNYANPERNQVPEDVFETAAVGSQSVVEPEPVVEPVAADAPVTEPEPVSEPVAARTAISELVDATLAQPVDVQAAEIQAEPFPAPVENTPLPQAVDPVPETQPALQAVPSVPQDVPEEVVEAVPDVVESEVETLAEVEEVPVVEPSVVEPVVAEPEVVEAVMETGEAAAPAAEADAAVADEAVRFGEIRTALAEGRLDEVDTMLSRARSALNAAATPDEMALAELTGLAGDHADEAGRPGSAKWLWRLALQRFASAGAMSDPAARAVAERLRLSGQ